MVQCVSDTWNSNHRSCVLAHSQGKSKGKLCRLGSVTRLHPQWCIRRDSAEQAWHLDCWYTVCGRSRVLYSSQREQCDEGIEQFRNHQRYTLHHRTGVCSVCLHSSENVSDWTFPLSADYEGSIFEPLGCTAIPFFVSWVWELTFIIGLYQTQQMVNNFT